MDESNRGAPIGNNNSRYGSIVRGAIRRALAENEAKGRDSLLNIAKKLIDDAEEGSLPAASLLFDRIDGKAPQQLTVDGDGEGGPVKVEKIVREVVRANP